MLPKNTKRSPLVHAGCPGKSVSFSMQVKCNCVVRRIRERLPPPNVPSLRCDFEVINDVIGEESNVHVILSLSLSNTVPG